MELGDEKVGASVADAVQLKKGSADHQALHVLIVDLHAARVREVDETFQGSVGGEREGKRKIKLESFYE